MTDAQITTKVFYGMDAARAALRKIGVKGKDYLQFVEKKHDGKFACDFAKARKFLSKPVKRTVSSVSRDLILAGKTNKEIWAVLVKEFSLTHDKRGYPAWYRSQCRHKGLI